MCTVSHCIMKLAVVKTKIDCYCECELELVSALKVNSKASSAFCTLKNQVAYLNLLMKYYPEELMFYFLLHIIVY